MGNGFEKWQDSRNDFIGSTEDVPQDFFGMVRKSAEDTGLNFMLFLCVILLLIPVIAEALKQSNPIAVVTSKEERDNMLLTLAEKLQEKAHKEAA